MNPRFEKRARQVRSRAAVRRWEYRQRNLAAGVWFRLRRVLVDAREAFVIPRLEAEALVAEGYCVEPVGAAIEPPKIIVFVPAARIAGIAARRKVPVRLGAELLGAEALALVPWDSKRL